MTKLNFIENENGSEVKRKLAPADRASLTPMSVVDKMFELYCAEKTFDEISAHTGVPLYTVQNYIYQGHPSRGLEPFKPRRERLWRAVQQKKDREIVDRLCALDNVTQAAIEAVGERYVKRIKAAEQLDDPDLYRDGNEAKWHAVQARALNPNTEDLKEVVELGLQMEKFAQPESKMPATLVQVNQQQGQTVDAEVDSADIEDVCSYIKHMQGHMDASGRKAVAQLALQKSIDLEGPPKVRVRKEEYEKYAPILEGVVDVTED
jgi:hypothetical protein